MEVLTKKRRAARGWVSRETNRLLSLLQSEVCEIVDIQRGIADLKVRVDKLDNVQSELELELDDNALDNDIEEAFTFLDDAREAIRQAEQRLPSSTPAPPSRSEYATSQVSAHGIDGDADIRRRSSPLGTVLPKLELPRFSGNYMEWTEFWDKFSAVIDASEIPTINKYSYLQSLLTGEALATIKGLSLTEANYDHAIALLKERFGRKERIILSHLQRLLNVEIPNVRVVSKLWQVYNDLQSNIRSLENLGVNGTEYGIVLTPMVLSRLPQELRLEWARSSENREGDLAWLLDFFRDEISRRERSDTYQKSPSQEHRREARIPSAAVLQTSSRSPKCVFCGKQHSNEKCWNLRKMPVADVKSILRDKNLCYRCFGSSHQARFCNVICAMCSGRHNKLFCTSTPSSSVAAKSLVSKDSHSNPSDSDPSRTDSINYHTSKFTDQTTTMQTLTVLVDNVPCNFLFDSGSDKSYVTSSFVKRVKPKYIGNENVSYVCFGERGPRNPTKRNVFEFKCRMTNGDLKPLIMTEIPMITRPMIRPKLPKDVLDEFITIDPHSSKQRFTKDENISIDVLIGLDYYWQVMTPNVIRLRNSTGLVAQESVFGWTLAGCYPTSKGEHESQKSELHRQNLCLTEISDTLIRRFWELDSLGIGPREERVEDTTLCSFNKSVRFVDGRYEVELPWKEESKPLLENNFGSAKQRLGNLDRRLERDTGLKSRYNAALSALETEGIIEAVPQDEIDNKGNPVFYLPHRPVIKESSLTTKVRPVFDASAKDKNGLSLNDCMNSGPNLIGNLLDIILRFRRWKYALSGDITKAFFQIQVNSVDQNVHRFLWTQGDVMRIMRITRVPFGNTASPFLLNATLKCHLSSQPSSRVVEELLSNLYVDDWLTGTDTVKEIEQLRSDAKVIMDKAHMPLTKWCSNSDIAADQNIQVLKEKDTGSEDDQHKVLGILWVSKEDCFSFTDLKLDMYDLVVTRRIVLSSISRIFDPMGFLQPFVMVAKIIFQGLWKLGLQWDEQIPKEQETKFLERTKQLSRLSEFRVPRCFVKLSWDNKQCIELHAFGDASEKGYGACIYLKVVEEDGSVTSSLVMAKAKLAPVKKITLPRLELLGALLSARLITHVRKALCLPEDTKCRCWTDSTVTLQWIQSDASKWKTFVSNRVTEIQELTSPDSWGHCPGAENPADILSRGVMLDSLLSSHSWLSGPSWLSDRDHIDNIDQTVKVEDNGDLVTDEHVDCSVQMSVGTHFSPVLPVERWGDFSKAVRICAFVLRFVNNLKCAKTSSSRSTGRTTTEELEQACTLILAETQRQYFSTEIMDLRNSKSVSRSSPLFKMKPFLGNDGLLRMKGRLQCSDLSFNEKHPILLPKCHISMLLCRREHKFLNHAGVAQMISSLRNQFWIINLRSVAKKVKRECVACSRHDARLPHQEFAPIPKERIVQSNPFSVVGVDYAGPLFTADFVGRKHYILLFTCAVVRAVHVELVDSLSLPDFLLAFRRFIARRGMPKLIISDNAKTFKSAAESLIKQLVDQGPRWQFITPRAPWFGGFWERLIKSIKLCLRKTLGLRTLTRSELETTLFQVEACINSRPLTTVHDVFESNEPLTPSHFLLGRGDSHRSDNGGISESFDNISGQDLRQMLLLKSVQLRKFWNVWQKEYIRNLPLINHSGVNKHVSEGMLCLVKEDNVSRMHWPLAKITQVFPGKDGVIRTVKVKMGKGHFTRPLNKICCLEILHENQASVKGNVTSDKEEQSEKAVKETEENDESEDNQYYATKFGRLVKPPNRF